MALFCIGAAAAGGPEANDEWPWHDRAASADVIRECAKAVAAAGDDDAKVLQAWADSCAQFGLRFPTEVNHSPPGRFFVGSTRYVLDACDASADGWSLRNVELDLGNWMRGGSGAADETPVFISAHEPSITVAVHGGVVETAVPTGLLKKKSATVLVSDGAGRLVVIDMHGGSGILPLPLGKIDAGK